MANSVLSKVKIGDTVYDLKDATARSNLATMLGDHAVAALGAAAWEGVAADINSTGLVSASIAKSYVDGEVAKINKFDLVVCEASASKIPAGAIYKEGTTTITGTMVASADTMFKIYLVKNSDAGAGAYVEWLSIRSGAGTQESPYVYAWESIGSTAVDLSGYVQKTTTIAGIDLQDNITTSELQTALGLEDLAYADTASGSFTPAGTISEVDATPAGTVTLNDFTQTATSATLTKGNFTPSGSITGSAISDGTISVSVKDAASATEATLTRGDYTPAGSVAITADNNGSFQVAGTNAASAVTVNSSNDTFVKSLKSGDVDAASIDSTKFSGGSFTGATAASFTQGAKASFTQGSKASLSTSDISYVESGVSVAVDSTDAEMLVFSNVTAKSAKAVDTFTANGDDTFVANGDDSFTANSVGTFTAASIGDGFFSAQKLPVVDGTASALTAINSAEAAAQVFTGNKYAPSFSGTKEENLKVTKAEYLKQEIDQATFSGTAATLGFSGTEAENVLVTAVSYDKATANGASFAGTANKITPTFTGTAGTVSVTPDSAT